MIIIESFFKCVVFPAVIFTICYLIIYFFMRVWENHKKYKKWKRIKPNKGDIFNPDINQRDLLLNAIEYKTNGHCPCVPKHNRGVDTICPCLEYRNGGICRCGLFVKEIV